DPVRGAPRRGLGERTREAQQLLDQRALGGMQARLRVGRRLGERLLYALRAGALEDRGDARVRVLHVVDGVLVGLLARQVEVQVERRVMRAREQIPARGVDA